MSPWLVKKEDRHKYGLREQEIIATNQKVEDVLITGFAPHPFWYSFHKAISAVNTPEDEQYIQCFENELRLPLKTFLISSLPNCSWILNVLHLGFGADIHANPIVIHVCIQTPHYFTDNEDTALEVVQGMEKIIKEKLDAQYHEKFAIDISQIYYPSSSKDEMNKNCGTDLRSTDSPRASGVNLAKKFPLIYLNETPCPGLSIGREETKQRTYPAGSLTGFLQQEDTIYSLTCSHVVFPGPNRPSERYKYTDGMEKFKISIPALKDHEATLKAMESTLRNATRGFEDTDRRQVMRPEMDLSRELQLKRNNANNLSELLKGAQDFNIHAGYVCVASEGWRKVTTYNGILDWALIRNACVNPSNRLPTFEFLGEPQISRFIEKFGDKYWSPDERKTFTAKCQALQDSQQFNISHPKSFLLSNEKRIFFKPSSRTMDWTACELNIVRAIVHNKNATSDEHVFIGDDTKEGKEMISDGGDSGALIYCLDVDIKGKTVLVPMAMVWGENKHGCEGFQGDVTYATPIEEVLKDIESEMGWKNGSLKFF